MNTGIYIQTHRDKNQIYTEDISVTRELESYGELNYLALSVGVGEIC